MFVFVVILNSLLRRKRQRDNNLPKSKKVFKKAALAFILAVMFGVGWIFSILGSNLGQGPALSFFFQFMFIIIVGGHGFFMFLVHTFRSKDARDEWKKWFYYITLRSQLYEEQIKSSLQKRSHGRPSLHSSSATPSKDLSDSTSSTLKAHSWKYQPPSSVAASTSFINLPLLPESAFSFDDGSDQQVVSPMAKAPISSDSQTSETVKEECKTMDASSPLPSSPESNLSYDINYVRFDSDEDDVDDFAEH